MWSIDICSEATLLHIMASTFHSILFDKMSSLATFKFTFNFTVPVITEPFKLTNFKPRLFLWIIHFLFASSLYFCQSIQKCSRNSPLAFIWIRCMGRMWRVSVVNLNLWEIISNTKKTLKGFGDEHNNKKDHIYRSRNLFFVF